MCRVPFFCIGRIGIGLLSFLSAMRALYREAVPEVGRGDAQHGRARRNQAMLRTIASSHNSSLSQHFLVNGKNEQRS